MKRIVCFDWLKAEWKCVNPRQCHQEFGTAMEVKETKGGIMEIEQQTLEMRLQTLVEDWQLEMKMGCEEVCSCFESFFCLV